MADTKQDAHQNTDKNSSANYYANLILQEWTQLNSWYESSARMVITYPLFINASAAIALVSFFARNDTPLYLKISFFSFLCGILFGIVTLILEYITPYIAREHFINHFYKEYSHEQAILKQKHDTYSFAKLKRIADTVKIRLFNGALAIACSFIGIFYIVNDIVRDHPRWILAITALFFIYSVYLGYQIYVKLNPKNTAMKLNPNT